jgi:hypothetical protein
MQACRRKSFECDSPGKARAMTALEDTLNFFEEAHTASSKAST